MNPRTVREFINKIYDWWQHRRVMIMSKDWLWEQRKDD